MTPTTYWDPQNYAKNARFVSDLGAPLLQWLSPKPKERILDLGCGDGALTEKIAAAGAAIFGIDASLLQAQAARERGIPAAVMDGRRMAFRTEFDAVFSNAALHWIKKPELVVQGVAEALKRGGRFVGELGGKGNVETIRRALHDALRRRSIDPLEVDPWYFPSAEDYERLLRQSGFAVQAIELLPRPTPLPGDIGGWLEVFAQPFTRAVSETARPAFIAEIAAALEPKLRANGREWIADYVRLRFHAVRN